MGLWEIRRAPQGGNSRYTTRLGHLEGWVCILIERTEMPPHTTLVVLGARVRRRCVHE